MFVPEEHNCIHMKEESPASHLIALDTKHVGENIHFVTLI